MHSQCYHLEETVMKNEILAAEARNEGQDLSLSFGPIKLNGNVLVRQLLSKQFALSFQNRRDILLQVAGISNNHSLLYKQRPKFPGALE